ncbi:MAG: sigma-54 dependent transcriptional regulator [Ignavibacteria bacterium]|nr:sigma-54 dependent transcriptional regulator [Ignavibacteria bacterium]
MKTSGVSILIVDDEKIVRESLTKWFREDGFKAESAASGAEALRMLQEHSWNILLVDIKMPGMDGVELLQRVREINPETTVIMITAFASVETAVKALKCGAYDYVTKPIDPDYLDHLVKNVIKERFLTEENIRLRNTVDMLSEERTIIGESAVMDQLRNTIRSVAPTNTTILIRGESGTGKELVAGAIHGTSPRRYFPLVVVNCGAMTESLLESELFGHERGAFTGAQYRRKGKVELADGGTLFLDEIGNIDGKTQMDLLRVLETKQFMRVGGSEMILSDFRVISATNRDLEQAVKEGAFREDLFYRLNVFPIEIPPLRSRESDIPILAHHFLLKHAKRMNKCVTSFSEGAMSALRTHRWPGNVRELENAVERALVLCEGDTIGPEHLSIRAPESDATGGKKLAEVERDHIRTILHETGWNISKSARVLDIDRVTLYNKIDKFGLKRRL